MTKNEKSLKNDDQTERGNPHVKTEKIINDLRKIQNRALHAMR